MYGYLRFQKSRASSLSAVSWKLSALVQAWFGDWGMHQSCQLVLDWGLRPKRKLCLWLAAEAPRH